MTRKVFLVLIVCLSVAAIAQENFEGLATVGAYGRFPAGLYGASNVVAPNNLVTVRNLETGQSERIIITSGVDEPGVFIVLSPEAATLLGVAASGATMVRVVPIVAGPAASIDAAEETALSQDPDINPAAGARSLLDTLPPPAGSEETASAAETTLPGVIALDQIPGEETVVVDDESTVIADMATVDELIAAAETPTEETTTEAPADETSTEEAAAAEAPSETPAVGDGLRTGVAAGVARTSVGQTQETFERPEMTLDSVRPAPVEFDAQPEEPAVVVEETEEAETAATSISSLNPAPDAEPDGRFAEPNPPAVAVAATEEETSTEPAPAETEAPAVVTTVSPIDAAIAAVSDRLPAKDPFPAPVGEDRDLGFASVTRPDASQMTVATLPEATSPGIEIPSLAGLGPLRAEPVEPEGTLAEAVPPERDIPDYEGIASRSAPSQSVSTRLPEASPEDEELPVVEGLGPIHAGTVDPVASLVEAQPTEEERPDTLGLAVLNPDEQPLGVTRLPEASPESEETPDGYALGPRTAGVPTAPDATLAEAAVPAEERPDTLGLAALSPDEQPIGATKLAEATPEEMETPDGYALGPRTAGVPTAPDATLAEATVPAEERPDLADLPGAEPDVADVDAVLVEATVEEEEAASVVDVGPAPSPTTPPFDAALAEATPLDEETPEHSFAAEEPGEPAGPSPAAVAAAEPPSVTEPELVNDSTPAETVPEDALLTLEPADFRPPVSPEPDDESIIDREEPTGETPAPLEVASEPEVREEEPEPAVAVVTVETRAETAPVVRVAPGTLPLVDELTDNRFYLQVGAYSNPATAQVTVDALGATYPMAVLPLDGSRGPVYRVLVGPLEQDETGTLLLWLRSRGYRDTFIRSGNEL